MTAAELALLGRYRYGPHWQMLLARDLGVSPRLIRYWLAGRRRIARRHADRIPVLARQRYTRRLAAERASFLGLVEALATPSLKAALLVA